MAIFGGGFVIIQYFVYFEHAMFWLPLVSPLLQVILLPLALAFVIWPDTPYTRPKLFPKEWPGSLYSWLVGKILFMGAYMVLPLSFLGHPINLTVFDDYQWYLEDDYAAISSYDAAYILILIWMSLPYIVPFAWANDFYMWLLQIPMEVLLYLELKHHLIIHWDAACQYDSS